MTTAARPLVGRPGADLTGVESRILRAALNLERRHVIALCNALALTTDETTNARVVTWERSPGRGYPPALVAALNALNSAVDRLARSLLADGGTDSPDSPHGFAMGETIRPSTHATLRRPLGSRRVLAVLQPDRDGLTFTTAQLDALENPTADLWQVLVDAAVVRAALYGAMLGQPVSVVLDKAPGTTA